MSRPIASRTAAFLIAVAAVTLACTDAQAQVKPFKIKGSGDIPLGISFVPGVASPHWSIGQATHLGKYYGEGEAQILAFTGPTTANFSSAIPFVFTAANGDDLAFTYGRTDNGAASPGEVTLFPVDNGQFIAVWVAEFNPVPELCTGRFAHVVDGSFIMIAETDPFSLPANPTDPTAPVWYSWYGNGWIELQK